MLSISRRQVLSGLSASALVAFLGRWVPAIAGPIGGRIVAVVNGVTTKRPEGPPEPAGVDTVVDSGTQIVTDKKSGAVVQLADGSSFTIGARSNALIGTMGTELIALGQGNFRFKSSTPGGENRALSTPALLITLKGTELVIQVKDNLTVCGVVSGVITCTSLRKGTSVDVSAGQSVAWAGGSFGTGVTEGIFSTGDLVADKGIEAARALWSPPPPPAPTPKPETPLAPPK